MSPPRPRGARGGRSRRGSEERVVWPPAARQRASEAIEALMRERGLARGFDPLVEREARRARDRGLDVRPDLGERRDLRSLATLTIDPASARDFDDAISAEPLGEHGTRVWVHIADVSAYVAPRSRVDLEARRRGTSVYAPGAVEPMLPQALSSDACSLLPGRERLAVTVELVLRGGRSREASFYRSLICSDARLDYEQVDRIFAGGEPAAAPWGGALRAARSAAAELQGQRALRGTLSIDSREPEFSFDRQGNVTGIAERAQTESHRLIEHLMIAANEAVARLLLERRVPCLYRVHERPDPERVELLVEQLSSLGVPTPPLPSPMSPSQAAELVGAVSQMLDAHLARAGRGRRALSALVLRSLKQAYYSPKNLGHAGLHASAYCHFTSPIRRYPDLVCHRALLSAIGEGEEPPRASELPELGAWSSECERAAMILERDADDIARAFALERELDERGYEEPFEGEVVGLIAAGAFVAFGTPEQPAAYEGMLPVRVMLDPTGARDWWELNEPGTILDGERTGAKLALGQELSVRVARVDAPRGRVDLLPAPVLEPPARSSRGRRPEG